MNTTGAVFLGLTLGCARCHDHKYDPVSQREFYQFFALMNGADEPTLAVPTQQQAKEQPALLAEIAQLEKRIMDVDSNLGVRQVDWEKKLLADPASQNVSDAIKQAVAVPAAERNDEQKKLLFEEFKKIDPERVAIAAQYAEFKERQKQLAAAITTTLVMKERPQPRETFIHIRGDFLRPGARVKPATPAVLPPIKPASAEANRLDLARWLVDPQNPLTPRVVVNRLWQQHFGQGIVDTENDFGTQGSPPTHPELLDWLARYFVESGWSMKKLHRLIVTSSTYRQSSAFRTDLVEHDANNKLLARQTRLRLDAELIRDAALAASGLLTREIGGPGVYPPQPQGIYRFTQQVKYWQESGGDDRYRRGMYTYFWRSSPYPFLMTFDAPDANTACTRRPRSNTPLQALTLANDRVFVEAAQGLAMRVLKESPSAAEPERLRYAFRLCFAREPSAVESSRLAALLAGQRQTFAAAEEDAKKVAPANVPPGSSIADAAAWTAVARVLLNLDEFITRE